MMMGLMCGSGWLERCPGRGMPDMGGWYYADATENGEWTLLSILREGRLDEPRRDIASRLQGL